MEQQNHLQGLNPDTTAAYSDSPADLEWNYVSAKVEFNSDGLYTVEGLDGFFTSRAELERAWRLHTSHKKLAQATVDLKHAHRSNADLTEAQRKALANSALKDREAFSDPMKTAEIKESLRTNKVPSATKKSNKKGK